MEEEYISISEFAKRAGVSPQAIYKRLSTDLSTELKVVDNRKMLKASALEKFGLNLVDNQFNNQVETVEPTKEEKNETIMMLQKTISLLETQTETLQQQLSLKDKQIEELNERLKESHVLIDQQQKLQAVSESRLELLEDKVADPEPEPDEEISVEPKKKHWWQFGRKDK